MAVKTIASHDSPPTSISIRVRHLFRIAKSDLAHVLCLTPVAFFACVGVEWKEARVDRIADCSACSCTGDTAEDNDGGFLARHCG